MSCAKQSLVLTTLLGLTASACGDDLSLANSGESESSTSSTQTSGPDTSDATETGEPAETESGETETGEPAETESGETETGDETETESETGEPPDTDSESDTEEEDEGWAEAETGEMVEELCASVGDPNKIVASIRDPETLGAHLLRGDGSVMTLDTSLPGADPDAELSLLMNVAGDYAIVLVYSNGYLSVYRLFDRQSGALVWEVIDTEAKPKGYFPYLGPDGRLAFSVVTPMEGDSYYSQVIGPNGQEALFEGDARGYVGPDQWIPLSVGESSPEWYNIETEQAWEGPLLGGIWEGYSYFWEHDGSLVYLSELDSGMALVEQRLDEVHSLAPWPELDSYLLSNDWWVSSSAIHERWVLITDDVEQRILHLDEDEVSHEFVLSPPPGYLEPGCVYSGRYAFDDLGGLVSTWTDGDSTNAWVLPEPGAQWQALDIFLDVTQARADIGYHSGTYWMEADATNSPGCGGTDNPPPEALPGDSLQLTRPSDGHSVASPHTELYGFVISPDGRCVARATSPDPGQPWRIDDLENGTWIEAPEPGKVRWHL